MTPFMSKTELDISQIRNVDIIRYYELPDKAQGLLLIYGGRTFINLCEYDSHWEMLAQAAYKAYLEDPAVCADEYTKDILESRKNRSVIKRFGFLTAAAKQYKKTVNCSLSMFPEEFIACFLSQIYKDLEADFALNEVKGWHGNYSISCKTDGKERRLPCRIEAVPEGYVYFFGNLFDPAHTARIKLRYGFGEMEIVTESETKRELRRESRYDFSANTLTRMATSDRQVIFHDESPLALPAAEMPESVRTVCGEGNAEFNGYALPWGEKVFIRTDGADETVFDNGKGLITQICREGFYGNRSGFVAAVHEVFANKGNMLIQSELRCRGLNKMLDGGQEGFYYRYIRGAETGAITDDLTGISSAQILDKYLYI